MTIVLENESKAKKVAKEKVKILERRLEAFRRLSDE
jgi:hypothetical protein